MKNILPLLALTSCANLGEPMYHETNQDWHSEQGQAEIDLYNRIKTTPEPYIIPAVYEYTTVDENDIEYKVITDVRSEIKNCTNNCH